MGQIILKSFVVGVESNNERASLPGQFFPGKEAALGIEGEA
jgi:hypothetical protein